MLIMPFIAFLIGIMLLFKKIKFHILDPLERSAPASKVLKCLLILPFFILYLTIVSIFAWLSLFLSLLSIPFTTIYSWCINTR
jgi:hypothetical protein